MYDLLVMPPPAINPLIMDTAEIHVSTSRHALGDSDRCQSHWSRSSLARLGSQDNFTEEIDEETCAIAEIPMLRCHDRTMSMADSRMARGDPQIGACRDDH